MRCEAPQGRTENLGQPTSDSTSVSVSARGRRICTNSSIFNKSLGMCLPSSLGALTIIICKAQIPWPSNKYWATLQEVPLPRWEGRGKREICCLIWATQLGLSLHFHNTVRDVTVSTAQTRKQQPGSWGKETCPRS